MAANTELERTLAEIEAGRAAGMHLGAQLAVWRDDELIADVAVGEARPGTPMTTEQMIIWWSMTKASTAVATALCWERGLLDVEAPVTVYVPEFGKHGKDALTLRHLLTHTGGFTPADRVQSNALDPDEWWDDVVRAICESPTDDGWVPGRDAGYHLWCSMQILGECVQRVSGRRYPEFVRDEIFLPLGMDDCWVGMPIDVAERYGDRLGTMFNTEGVVNGTEEEPRSLALLDQPAVVSRSMPGGYGRGPMNQLVRMYRMLVRGGELDGVRILRPQTVAAASARHRTGIHDRTFGVVMDWGLGFNIDGGSMGRHCSPRTFGHGGAQSSVAFADPEFGIAAAIQVNGMPGNEAHYKRFARICTALYDDLGVHWAGPEGRDKPLPGAGMASA
ncbi:MAG TPA: serine hydrolase domain-containing protein [Acidimicrobiales bacterium]|jgi:CubicO group peptidase (beta-lactamase class C family)|nr:serine hydrolase domain-containing protein [Acidimicrobiales bacterium]